MRAVRLDACGPPENLQLVEREIPAIGPDDVLIRVELAGLIYGDAEARRGTYYVETKLPWFPGREAGGFIEAVGENVAAWKPGDRIMALVLSGGCCADYVVASTKAANIVALPENVSFAQGLVYLVNFRLAHMLFHGSSKVPRGETIIVQGASGGMGAMLTQIALAHGCTVIGTCRTEAEETFLRDLGAQHVINVTRASYVDAVRAIGGEIRFIFNGVGGATLAADADILAPFGEIQAYGYVAGKQPFDLFSVAKSIALRTFSADDFIRTPMFAAATEAMHARFREGPLIAAQVLPLAEVAQAHRMLDEGRVVGKIALEP